MIYVRKLNDRGITDLSWLKSYHTFSFANYFDPSFMGFGPLRVINEDTVLAGHGFNSHAHQNMEIISYVVSGELAHKDSMGTGSVIKPGEIQRMSAGTGVTHSEFNSASNASLHFLQIWIIPEKEDLQPSYEQNTIPHLKNQLILIGSPHSAEHAVTIHQQIKLYVGYFTENFSYEYKLPNHHKVWLQLIKGKMTLNSKILQAGDGAAIDDEEFITLKALESAEFLLFDME